MKTYNEIVPFSIAIALLVTSEFANGALLIALKYRKLKSMQVSFIRRLSVCYMLYGAMFGLVLLISVANDGQFFATGTLNCALQGILSDAFNFFIAWQMLLLSIERYNMISIDDIPTVLKKHSGVVQGFIVVASLTYALSIGCQPKSYQYVTDLYRCTWSVQSLPLALYFGIGILPSVLSFLVTLMMISVPIRIRKSNSIMPQNRYEVSIIEEVRNSSNEPNSNSRLLNEKINRSASAALLSIPISLLLIAPFLFHLLEHEYPKSLIFYNIWNLFIPLPCLIHPCVLLLRNKEMTSLLKKFFCCKLVAVDERRRSFKMLFRHPLEARENASYRRGRSSPTGEFSFLAEITTSSGNDRYSKIRISNESNCSSFETKMHNVEKSDSNSRTSKHSSISTKIKTRAEVHRKSSLVHFSRSSKSSSVGTKSEGNHHDQGASCNHSLQSNKSSIDSEISIISGKVIIPGRKTSSTNSSEFGFPEYFYRTSDSIPSNTSSVTAKITIQKRKSTIQLSTASNSPDITATLDFHSCSPDSMTVNFEDFINTSPSISSNVDCIQIKRYSQSI